MQEENLGLKAETEGTKEGKWDWTNKHEVVRYIKLLRKKMLVQTLNFHVCLN